MGALDLAYESMELPADPGRTIHVYGVEAASPSTDALNLLDDRAGCGPALGCRDERIDVDRAVADRDLQRDAFGDAAARSLARSGG